MSKPAVTLFLDTRRILKSGKFRIRLRVDFYRAGKRTQLYFNCEEEASRSEWEQIQSGSVRGDLRRIRTAVIAKEQEANGIVEDMPYVSPDSFSAIFMGRRTKSAFVKDLFDEIIAQMNRAGQISSAGAYAGARDALLARGNEGLILNIIDKDWLKDFEVWMLQRGRSISTIGIYLRSLRHVFNVAIERKILPAELYPFGRKKYIIPTSRNVKKAMTKADKERLLSWKPSLRELANAKRDKKLLHIVEAKERALRDFTWSYYCNGMNFADMAQLKATDVRGDLLMFYRRKSLTTERERKPQVITMRPELKKILSELNKEGYLFDVLLPGDSPKRVTAKVRQWIKRTNKWLKVICAEIGIERVKTSYARHTAATMLIRAGADMHYVKDALGHSSITTTERYMATLDLEEQRKLTAKL